MLVIFQYRSIVGHFQVHLMRQASYSKQPSRTRAKRATHHGIELLAKERPGEALGLRLHLTTKPRMDRFFNRTTLPHSVAVSPAPSHRLGDGNSAGPLLCCRNGLLEHGPARVRHRQCLAQGLICAQAKRVLVRRDWRDDML